MVNTPRAAMQAVQQKLAEAGLDSVQFESRILLETVLELPYGAPLPQQPLTGAQQQRLAELTARRCAHEPLQYLCGTWEFFGLEFQVGEGVLIPRQDTETLVEAVLELRKNEPSTCLLDLCSGSGCIPSALSVHLSGVTGAVLELSPEAMGYLRQNLKRHAPQLECIAGTCCTRRQNCCTGSSTSSPVTRPISPQQIWSSFSRKSPVNRKPPCSAAPTGWTSTES